MSTIGLRGRIAIVTGASRRTGIGAAICRALAANGVDIFITHGSAFDKKLPWGGDEAAWISGQVLHSRGGFL